MRKHLLLVISIVIIAGCKSSEKLLDEGNYDKVIDKSIKSLIKDKNDEDDVLMLDKAYKLANARDLERIKLLKTEGKPENWEQIYFLYSSLDYRQKAVRKVLPMKANGKVYDYEQVDYTNSIVEAKTKAAEYFYANGKNQMGLNTKNGFREAYYNFVKAKDYRGSAFTDIDQLIEEARYRGTSRVLVDVSNNSPFRLQPDFFDNLMAINTSDFDNQWVEYHLGRSDRKVEYDYYVTILLKNILVSREQYSQKEYIRKKQVSDGFSYALDSRGNVRKDSLGNDIKIPKYKELTCTVIERQQYKNATVEAQIEYMAVYPNRRVMKLIPVSATSVFEHFSGRAVGDREALLPEDLNLLKNEALPFPDDISMIYDCIPSLQQAISAAMRDNRSLIY